ncbi:sigma-70 family RNA polymerase sigma factor [Synechococcus sp. UW179B]|uniref:sigma-70 family RNA polymerase sigma factor n=1 Tax=Synechococcus sp. UW179B TaxID=2575516 RepID=UPI000E0FE350|nr:sigma-70 family RNA polymerase sigma factor [Synechococcus sp. UW179B]
MNKRQTIRNERIERHLNLVDPIAGHYAKRSGLDRDDLKQVGRLGLLRAAEGYEQGQDKPFEVYARPHIKGAILHYLRDSVGLIRLPRRLQEQAQSSIKNSSSESTRSQGMTAEIELNVQVYRRRQSWEPLDESRVAANQPEWQPLLMQERARRVWDAINGLSPAERRALVEVVIEGASLRGAGKKQGVSAMTMQRRLKRALAQLRQELADQDSSL